MAARIDTVYPGIVRIRLNLPGGKPDHVNTYLFTGRKPLLFDTGMKQTADDLEAALARFSLTFSDLDRVVLSHRHFDHYGAGALIARRARRPVPMLAHHTEAPLMAGQNGLGLPLFDLWPFLNRAGLPLKHKLTVTAIALVFKTFAGKIQASHLVRDGETLTAGNYRARIIEAPGHSRGVLCLHLPDQGLLFSSDHILPYLPHSDPYLFQARGQEQRLNQEDFFASLDTILALDPATVFPGHGDPIDDLGAVVSAYRREYHKKDQAIMTVIENRPDCTVYDIVQRLFPRVLKPMKGFPVYIAVSEVYTHIQVLEKKKRILSRKDKGVIRFLPHPGSSDGH